MHKHQNAFRMNITLLLNRQALFSYLYRDSVVRRKLRSERLGDDGKKGAALSSLYAYDPLDRQHRRGKNTNQEDSCTAFYTLSLCLLYPRICSFCKQENPTTNATQSLSIQPHYHPLINITSQHLLTYEHQQQPPPP
jgi:hypothetical protein